MRNISRRSLVRNISFGTAAACFLNDRRLFLPQSLAADVDAQDRRFFLQLYMPEGLNAAYFFDARPLSMTKAGKIQNYLNEDPFVWEGVGPDKAFATRIVKPLIPLKDYFSVVNGVFMSIQSDGHEENRNFSLTSSTVGGTTFFSMHANRGVIDSLNFIGQRLGDGLKIETKNGGLSFESIRVFRDLSRGLESDLSSFRSDSKLMRQLGPQLQALALKNGKLAEGSKLLKQSFDQIPEFSKRFVETGKSVQATEDFEGQIEAILNAFRFGLTDNAILAIDGDRSVDFHDGKGAKENCEKSYAEVVSKFEKVIQKLRNTPVDPRDPRSPSFYESTTFLMTSEFNRTMRQINRGIDETGTDHNTLGNSVWIGGGRIKGGRVVGATDLTDINDKGEFLDVSTVHTQFDPHYLKVMGKPFDFKNQGAMKTLPAEYDPLNYIQYGSVVNTVLKALEVPKDNFWKTGQNETAPELPLLTALI